MDIDHHCNKHPRGQEMLAGSRHVEQQLLRQLNCGVATCI
jgi:hypothetical protein